MRLAFLMAGSNAVAEDLVHDVFVRVADRVESLADPGPYLRVAVVNACRRHHLPDGRLLRPGDRIDAGGGYHRADQLGSFTQNPDVAASADECTTRDQREVAVIQSWTS